METVLDALGSIRAPRMASEYDLHAIIAQALAAHSLPCRHEAPIAKRRRIDLLCGSIGLEVKRGRPQRTPLLRQLEAYAASELITGLVLIAEWPPRLPNSLCGKPLATVSLQRLWGIAL